MQFIPYQSQFTRVRHERDWAGISARSFYAGALRADIKTDGIRDILAAEEKWHQLQQPYFKLWPRIVNQLLYTSLNFPTKYLRLPFPSFTILLPPGMVTIEADRGRLAVDNFLICDGEHSDDRSIGIFGWNRDNKQFINIRTRFSSDTPTVEDGLLVAAGADRGFTEIRRLAIGASMFGIDKHELVCPDIPRSHIDKYLRAKELGDSPTMAACIDKAKRLRMNGFHVGREIDLPLAEVAWHDTRANKTPQGERQFAHIRRGHMRLQPCGEKNQDRKLIFVPPTIVRPDLPMTDAARGYRIRRPDECVK